MYIFRLPVKIYIYLFILSLNVTRVYISFLWFYFLASTLYVKMRHIQCLIPGHAGATHFYRPADAIERPGDGDRCCGEGVIVFPSIGANAD